MLSFQNLANLFQILSYLILGFTLLSILHPLSNIRFKIYFHENDKNKKRILKCPHIKKGIFLPTIYLLSGTLQAIFGKFSKFHDTNIHFKEENLDLPCGGIIGMYWASQILESESSKTKAKKVVVIMVPGLTASFKEPYIRNISTEALENGYKVVVYHNRGNQVALTLPKEGYLDPVSDFEFAVDYVVKTHPDHTIFAVGHSLGANTLVNYLAKCKDKCPIKVAASVSNPFDFHKAGHGVKDTMFDGFLAQMMQNWARRNQDVLLNAPKYLDLNYELAMKATTLRGFDEQITRRIYGYPHYNDYYTGISSAFNIKDIKIPLLCLNSKDDPVLHHGSICIEECKQNENIILIVTHNGGHVGWFHGTFQPRRWYPKPVVEYLNVCFEELHHEGKIKH